MNPRNASLSNYCVLLRRFTAGIDLIYYLFRFGVAQMVEREAVNFLVGGSSPSPEAKFIKNANDNYSHKIMVEVSDGSLPGGANV